MEASVLNDTWVSVPVGSEDSSKYVWARLHLRERACCPCGAVALFRCEDERFKIDMVIESTASTVKLLEPLAEEV
ncbi:hypothetical protein JKP88DRAFT_156254, partial [Tribonema minus]